MSLGVRFSIFSVVLLWLAAIFVLFLVPYFDQLVNLYPIINLFSSRVCHQLPNKLITFHEAHSLVCARCAGIYAGAFAGSAYTLFNNKFKIRTKLLFLSGVPLTADVILYSSGVYSYSHYVAFFTGLLFGTISFFYIFQGLNLLISELRPGK